MEQTMEQKILNSVTMSINTSIDKTLTGYESPLKPIINEVLGENRDKVIAVVRESFDGVFESTELKNAIKEEMIRKMARILIAKSTGELESVMSKIRSNPETGANLTLGISKVIKELLKSHTD